MQTETRTTVLMNCLSRESVRDARLNAEPSLLALTGFPMLLRSRPESCDDTTLNALDFTIFNI